MLTMGYRCVENCEDRVSREKNLTLRVVCIDHCISHIRPTIDYQWRLFIGGTSATDSFTELMYNVVYYISSGKNNRPVKYSSG